MSGRTTTLTAETSDGSEAEMARRWAAGVRGPLRLRDGRPLHIVFPGVPGGGPGPDFRGAILDAGGDLLRGDVELHVRTGGWRAHGHRADPAYAGVVLHVVQEAAEGEQETVHANGRRIPLLVLPPPAVPGAGFTPPCAFARARDVDDGGVLERLGLRRLRIKAARAAALIERAGPGEALYALLLEQLGGSANRAAFASIARWLPLAVLLERAEGRNDATTRTRALAAELRGAAATLILRRAGSRPLASPARRLEIAAACVAAWFPGSDSRSWPCALTPDMKLPVRAPGVSRHLAIELALNVVLPVALAVRAWPEAEVEAAWLQLPSPGTYGKLRPLEGWIGHGERVFTRAARLQGGLLLHADYCTRGMCGRCPLS